VVLTLLGTGGPQSRLGTAGGHIRPLKRGRMQPLVNHLSVKGAEYGPLAAQNHGERQLDQGDDSTQQKVHRRPPTCV
jgi:hypothetical protein